MKKFVFVVLVGSMACCVSCGDDDCPTCPRPPGVTGSPPVISTLQCSPSSAEIGQDGGAIQMNCSLFFRDPDGDLDRVVYSFIDGCGVNPGPLGIDVSGQAGRQQQGTIQLANLQVQTDCVADTYTYQFTAVDGEDGESNDLVLQFVLVEP